MIINIPESVLNEQDVYIKKAKSFINGELSDDEFYPYASSMGVYRQREQSTFMIRPRIFSGIVTYEQLKKIYEISHKYCGGEVHLTTRQSVQFHKLRLEDTVKIFEEMKDVNLVNKGAGGNSIRNIASPATSGVDMGEIFDVSPYALAATEFALGLGEIVKLPRKYKIAFSNSHEDKAYALYSDLGFIANKANQKKGFEAYVAGGLGNKPSLALKISDFIDTDEIYAYILAMKLLFEDHGNREDRSKARIRFIRYRLGDDEFKKLCASYVEKAKLELGKNNFKSGVDFSIFNNFHKNSLDSINLQGIDDGRISPQKQEGEFSFLIQPSKGDLKASDLKKLIDFVEENSLSNRLEYRLTNTQSLLVRRLKLSQAKELSQIISETKGRNNIERSVSCTGAKNCRIGLCDSQGLLEDILKLAESYEESKKNRLPKIFVSGCKNSCGWHWVGNIGFAGKKVKSEEGLKEGFEIYLGGGTGRDSSKLADLAGLLESRKILDLLKIIFDKFLSLELDDFQSFLDTNSDFIRDQIESLSSNNKVVI